MKKGRKIFVFSNRQCRELRFLSPHRAHGKPSAPISCRERRRRPSFYRKVLDEVQGFFVDVVFDIVVVVIVVAVVMEKVVTVAIVAVVVINVGVVVVAVCVFFLVMVTVLAVDVVVASAIFTPHEHSERPHVLHRPKEQKTQPISATAGQSFLCNTRKVQAKGRNWSSIKP